MRILTRYILKEVFSHSLLGLLIFTFVIFIPHISHLLELVVRHDLSGTEVVTLFLLPLPGIVVLTIPMAALVGILIGLSRMARLSSGTIASGLLQNSSMLAAKPLFPAVSSSARQMFRFIMLMME